MCTPVTEKTCFQPEQIVQKIPKAFNGLTHLIVIVLTREPMHFFTKIFTMRIYLKFTSNRLKKQYLCYLAWHFKSFHLHACY